MNEFENDINLQLADLVHDLVSNNKIVKSKIDEALEEGEETYTVTRATFERLSALTELNVYLLSKLFEENQTIADNVADLLKKHTPKQD